MLLVEDGLYTVLTPSIISVKILKHNNIYTVSPNDETSLNHRIRVKVKAQKSRRAQSERSVIYVTWKTFCQLISGEKKKRKTCNVGKKVKNDIINLTTYHFVSIGRTNEPRTQREALGKC